MVFIVGLVSSLMLGALVKLTMTIVFTARTFTPCRTLDGAALRGLTLTGKMLHRIFIVFVKVTEMACFISCGVRAWFRKWFFLSLSKY